MMEAQTHSLTHMLSFHYSIGQFKYTASYYRPTVAIATFPPLLFWIKSLNASFEWLTSKILKGGQIVAS